MKVKYLLLLSLLVISATAYAQPQVVPPFHSYLENGIYVFDDELKIKRTELFTFYKTQFGLTDDDQMVLDEEQFIEPTDPNDEFASGSTQARYRQYHKGFLVETRQLNVVSKCGVVLMVSGSIIPGMTINENNTISEASALQEALDAVNPPAGFLWQDAEFEGSLISAKRTDYETDSTGYDSTLTYYPKGQMLVAQVAVNSNPQQEYALCWKFNIAYLKLDTTATGVDTSVAHQIVYVDAHNGIVYNEYNPDRSAFYTNGNVSTPYNGTVGIETRTCTFCSNYTLTDHRSIFGFDYKNNGGQIVNSCSNCYPDKYVVKAGNNNWVTATEKSQASPYWCIERAYDYFLNKQGIHSGNQMDIWVNSNNAKSKGGIYWTENLYYGQQHDQIEIAPDGFNGVSSYAALDVMGHEFTHAKIRRSSNVGVGTYGEPQAIQEGFCDIFGFLIETWDRGWADWHIGEQIGQGRGMHTPSIDSPPSSNYYQDVNWYNSVPYSMSGPLRKWFTHLSQGEWNWTPAYSGVGLTTAERLAFITMYWWLWQGSDYHHLRNQSLAVADIHFGGICQPVWRKVLRAWNDVGVFGAPTPCNPWRLSGTRVVTADQLIPGSTQPVKFAVRSNFGVDELPFETRVLSCTWHLPPGWTGTFSPDNMEFILNNVPNFNSQAVKVDVTYEENGTPQTRTFSHILHFSDDCSPGSMARMAAYAPAVIMGEKAVSVYPNPTTGQLTVVLPGDDDNINAELVDITGRRLFSATVHGGINQLNLPELPNGVYLLKINGHRLQHTERVTIQR